MAHAVIEAKFKAVLAAIDRELSPLGFRKRGASWRSHADGNTALVEVQRSHSSTADAIRFTVNVGVVSSLLLAHETDVDLERATTGHAHLRERLGAFLPEREDRWWTLDQQMDPKDVLAQLVPLLERATDYLSKHISDAQLVNLWNSGRSPGLTEGQRQRHLRTLTT